jgi:predicted GTPase
LLDPKGRTAVSIVDTQGFDHNTEGGLDLVAQAERADLIMWVASAIQPAREPDRKQLDIIRTWANEQLMRRTPPILLALTHMDQLRPAAEWSPPYNIEAPAGGKARAIRAAVDASSRALDLPVDSIIPVAMPPDRKFYNIDMLWARIALESDEARLVQLDRLRLNQQGLSLRVLAGQLRNAGHTIIKGAVRL